MVSVDDLERELKEAHAASGQGSYERRAPEPEARIAFVRVRRALRGVLSGEPDNVRALLLLASSEEGLLNYPAAVAALERALQIVPAPDRRVLKQLARVREYARTWRYLNLTPDELETLGDYLRDRLPQFPCDDTTRLTQLWIEEHHPKKIRAILRGLQSHGGYCDCEVLANAVIG
jgi:hypothetical protein